MGNLMKNLAGIAILVIVLIAWPAACRENRGKVCEAMDKKPMKQAQFIEGPAITPSGSLLDYLKDKSERADGSRALFRLPVVIRFEDSFQLSIKDAFIGVSDGLVTEDTLFLSLDDSAMGISLLSGLRDIIPPGRTWIAVWLEGYWGRVLDVSPGGEELHREISAGDIITRWPFAPRKISGPLKEAESKQEGSLKVFIELSSP